MLSIANVYGQLLEHGFSEKALQIPRSPDQPDDFILYVEFVQEGESVSVGFASLDESLTPEDIVGYLEKTVRFMKQSLSMLVFSGRAHYQDQQVGGDDTAE